MDVSHILIYELLDFLHRNALVFRPEGDLVGHGGVYKLAAGILEKHSRLKSHLADAVLGYVFAPEAYLAAQLALVSLGHYAVQGRTERGLSCTRRAGNKNNLTFFDRQVDILDRWGLCAWIRIRHVLKANN